MSPGSAPVVRVPPPLIALVAILAGVALDRLALDLAVGLLGGAVRWGAAAAFGSTGVALIGLAFIHFRRTGQDPKPWTHSPELIREGIYRHSRNPMYVGLALIQLGVGLGLDNLWIVILVFPALVVIYRTAVRPEEAYLEREFGSSYRRYRDSVRRWL